jgi:uncharacterized protein YajQ (UPF0234 family)
MKPIKKKITSKQFVVKKYSKDIRKLLKNTKKKVSARMIANT